MDYFTKDTTEWEKLCNVFNVRENVTKFSVKSSSPYLEIKFSESKVKPYINVEISTSTEKRSCLNPNADSVLEDLVKFWIFVCQGCKKEVG